MARRLVWAAWLAGPLADTPVHAQAPTLTVRVRNDARVPDRILAEAEAFVTRTYAVAGVDVAWLPRVADVTLVTLPREGAERMHQAPDCMGYAPAAGSQGGRLAYVLQHRVDAVARGYGAQPALVLGAALGHELGHLLLPPHSHSASGLMRAQWNQADFREAGQGRLLLAPEQAAQIRTLLISRLALVASQRFVLGIERLEHR